MVGSLVAQLCSQIECPEELIQAYRSSNTLGQRRPPNWELLRETLSWFSKDRKILLLVDALDECVNRGDVLNLLSSVLDNSKRLNILVTSREKYDIEDAFQTFRSCSRIRMENCRAEMDRDIKLYIDHRLEVGASFKGLGPSVKADIRHSLSKRSAGV